MNSRFLKRFTALAAIVVGLSLHCMASPTDSLDNQKKDWLNIVYSDKGEERVNAHPVEDIERIYYSWKSPGWGKDSQIHLSVDARSDGSSFVALDSILSIDLATNIPSVYLTTVHPVKKIISKKDYLDAEFRFVPYGFGGDVIEKAVKIRGRGNSSWGFPKKSYRLKFPKKVEIGSLPKAKNFNLISNYIDKTLMRNVVAFKIAELVGLPYSNRVIPVNVFLNGTPQGSYILTNKVGINSGSVDIDEAEGILWEVDTNFDEGYKFKDPLFDLPFMVKDPDFAELAPNEEAREAMWQNWRRDMEEALQLVKEGRWEEAFDKEQMARYFFVNCLVLNGELSYPKSMYLYKERPGGKYKMGPVWDFDIAFASTMGIDWKLLTKKEGMFYAYDLFSLIFETESFREAFREVMRDFEENKMQELMDFIDGYATMIGVSALQDLDVWPEPEYREIDDRKPIRFRENVEELTKVVIDRLEQMKSSPDFLLY